MIDQRARDELLPIVREYRAADRRHRDAEKRVERAARNLARDPFRPAYVVEHAVAQSVRMAASADLAALREELKMKQRAGR